MLFDGGVVNAPATNAFPIDPASLSDNSSLQPTPDTALITSSTNASANAAADSPLVAAAIKTAQSGSGNQPECL